MYQKLTKIAEKFLSKSTIFKWGFNISPMYKRSCAKITHVSKDLKQVVVKIPLSWKNKNYVGTIFGGSLFSATDPIYMIQLIQILGDNFVVWDKATNIRFKRPANSDAFVNFVFSNEEIEKIKAEVLQKKEIDIIKNLLITDADKKVFVELDKTLYIADKAFYRQKIKAKKTTTQKATGA